MVKGIIRKLRREKKKRKDPGRNYLKYCDTLPLQDKSVLVEASRGSNVDGNMFYCAREILINPIYKEYSVYLVVKNTAVQEEAVLKYGDLAEKISFVKHHTDEYYRLLATCKYLLNDATFGTFFVKRDGQVLLNTWHGTPLKTMGRKNISEFDVLGNVQHNLSMADYVLSPNYLTEKVMTEDYMLNDMSRAKQLHCGYPRNIAFDEGRVASTKKLLGLADKTVYAYLPTWRGKSSHASEDANKELELHLEEIDKLLNDDEIMLAKLHHLSRTEIDFNEFSHIVDFPDNMETYEVLNAAEALVTDYSSVLFDYAVSRRPIVLYTYDREEYEKDRGFNIELDRLPFEQVDTAEELVETLRKQSKAEEVYDAFVAEFCPWDDCNSAKNVVSQLIYDTCEKECVNTEANGKPNILLYGGSLESENALNAIRLYLSRANLNEANFYIVYYTIKKPEAIEAFRLLLEEYPSVRYLELRGDRNQFNERKKGDVYEYRRLFGGLRFKEVISLEIADRKLDELFKAVRQ